MKHLTLQQTGPIATLTINRPKALNALNTETLHELKSFLDTLPTSGIRVLIVTGAEKAFVAGADISEMQPMRATDMLGFCDLGQGVMSQFENAPCVTIAAVNGYCLGGGLELALGCDFIYASENAQLGLPECGLGLIPGFGGTQRLARAIGTRRAKDLIFSARRIKAQEACSIGLVNHVVPAEQLLPTCIQAAEAICKQSFFAVMQAKRAINRGENLSMQEALELEKQCCAVAFGTADREEGMKAFLEKRAPAFAGV